jgi:hypothetical protein
LVTSSLGNALNMAQFQQGFTMKVTYLANATVLKEKLVK